jgi:uncharacterized protein YndB with AHSA1/START domain
MKAKKQKEARKDVKRIDQSIRRETVTARVFDAPHALVFESWTDPEQLKLWWGPRGLTYRFHQFDIKPGGAWRFTIDGPDGNNYENEADFVEIDAPARIVLDPVSQPHFRLTVLFGQLGGQTRITFRQLFETSAVYDGVKPIAVDGTEDKMDRLASLVAKRRAAQERAAREQRAPRPGQRGCPALAPFIPSRLPPAPLLNRPALRPREMLPDGPGRPGPS